MKGCVRDADVSDICCRGLKIPWELSEMRRDSNKTYSHCRESEIEFKRETVASDFLAAVLYGHRC